jgi:hypothetical protein
MVDGKLLEEQSMTLVMLKLFLQTVNKDLEAETNKATLRFKDVNQQRGDDPEAQAWPSFHDSENWNATGAQIQLTTNVNAAAGGGHAESSLSLGWDTGREITGNRQPLTKAGQSW